MSSLERAHKAQETDRFGRYEVIRKLASGGMGEVYLAKSIGAAGFQKHVVIKKILPHLTDHPQTVKSLVREAKLLVLLNHPNIVQVFDLGVEGSDYFMAMEYVHGYNLSNILHFCSKQKLAIPSAVCAHIGIEVLRALAYAHELRGTDGTRQNIIHRDVSPQNVMLSSSGQVKLTDFGIAKVLSEAEDEQTQSLKGKWRYMAPEALDGGRIDQRYDLFAVGILLFESLCRRNLFSGKRDVDILNQVREARVPDIRKYHPEVSDEMVLVVEKSLARNPEARYQTSRELEQALLSALPVSESQATDQLRTFLTDLYGRDEFPINKPKILDPNAADQNVTRSLMLKSRLSDVPFSSEKERRGGIAVVLLAFGLVALSSVVAYIAYTVLFRTNTGPGGDNRVIIIDKTQPDARMALSPTITDLGVAARAPDSRPRTKGHIHRPPAGPFDVKVGARVFSGHLRALERCLKQHAAPGQSVIKFVVASTLRGNGRVSKVVLTPPALTATPLGQCVATVASHIRYPAHASDGITFVQPITLKKTPSP